MMGLSKLLRLFALALVARAEPPPGMVVGSVSQPLVADDGLPTSHLPFAFHFETAERKPFFVFADSVMAKLEWLRVLLVAATDMATLLCLRGVPPNTMQAEKLAVIIMHIEQHFGYDGL